MDTRTLQCLLVIAEEQHITRAAERLQMAQPNLTRIMRKLEAELGFALFDRSNKRQFALTPAGQFFLDKMARLLPEYEHVVQAAQRIAQGEKEKLVVGYVPVAMLSNILPLAIGAFERVCVGELILHDLATQSYKGRLKALREHHLDTLLMTADPGNEPGIEQALICSAPFMVALPRIHRLAHLEAIPLSALAEEAWVEVSHRLHPGLMDTLTHLCQQSGFTPRVVRQVPHIQTILSLVAGGVGIAFVTAWTSQALQPQDVVYRSLLDMSYQAQLYLLWRKNDSSPLLQAFRHCVLEASSRSTDASASSLEHP